MTETHGIEAFVRSSPPAGARDSAARTVDRLRTLVEAGRVDEYSVYHWGRTVDPGAVPPCLEMEDLLFDRVGSFRSWAVDADVELEGFVRREAGGLLEEPRTVLAVPVVALAEYVDGELVGVAPHSGGGETLTVEGYLDALESTGCGRRTDGDPPAALPTGIGT